MPGTDLGNADSEFEISLGVTNLRTAAENEELKNLMMAWYYAGYYTGLHEGQQKAQQQQHLK
jgi:hypothetical protein